MEFLILDFEGHSSNYTSNLKAPEVKHVLKASLLQTTEKHTNSNFWNSDHLKTCQMDENFSFRNKTWYYRIKDVQFCIAGAYYVLVGSKRSETKLNPIL